MRQQPGLKYGKKQELILALLAFWFWQQHFS